MQEISWLTAPNHNSELYVFCTMHYSIITQYKRTKCTFSKSIFIYLLFTFIPIFIHLYLGLFICTLFIYLLSTRLIIPMHVKFTIPQLYIQLSSWRWTFRFETCRRHPIKNLNINLENVHFVGLYCITTDSYLKKMLYGVGVSSIMQIFGWMGRVRQTQHNEC